MAILNTSRCIRPTDGHVERFSGLSTTHQWSGTVYPLPKLAEWILGLANRVFTVLSGGVPVAWLHNPLGSLGMRPYTANHTLVCYGERGRVESSKTQ